MNAMLMTMSRTPAMRLRTALSWRSGGSTPVGNGNGHIAFRAIEPACGSVGEQRKGNRVSASGEAV